MESQKKRKHLLPKVNFPLLVINIRLCDKNIIPYQISVVNKKYKNGCVGQKSDGV